MQEKLLYVCKSNPFFTHGGAAIRNKAIIYLLSKKYDVHLACFSSSDQDHIDAEKKIYSIKSNPDLFSGLLSERSLSVARFYSVAMTRLMRRLVRANAFAVAYVSELAMFQYAKHCVSEHPTKIVLDCHNIESALLREGIPYQSWWYKCVFGLEYYPLSLFEGEALRKSDLIVFVSDDDKKTAIERHGGIKKTLVIPNCLEVALLNQTSEYKTGPTSKLDRFAIVGTLDWHANRIGITWFIHTIWNKYASANRDAELHLIGKQYRTTNDFAGRGIVQHRNVGDVGQLLSSVDVCLAPLLYGGGTRLKILEYFYRRKPVIATSKAAHGLELTPGIHYLRADNYREFERAVQDLTDVDLRSRLIE